MLSLLLSELLLIVIEKVTEKISKSETGKKKINFDDYTLQEWQVTADMTAMAERIETIVTRVCYYPALEEKVLQK